MKIIDDAEHAESSLFKIVTIFNCQIFTVVVVVVVVVVVDVEVIVVVVVWANVLDTVIAIENLNLLNLTVIFLDNCTC
jgi:hypothetical protein